MLLGLFSDFFPLIRLQGLVFVGLGIIIPWLSINTYIIDAFSLYAASGEQLVCSQMLS